MSRFPRTGRKSAEAYRARVIQLESFVARLLLTHNLSTAAREVADYVTCTSVAMTEEHEPDGFPIMMLDEEMVARGVDGRYFEEDREVMRKRLGLLRTVEEITKGSRR